ncbi:MAG: RnfABCDGE type electron transport complex subunit G [Prevotellaceae bacterium]|jgi:electron transport complex protein RnfG|nr:RnfABCDGE type electron transport complex subunit G [Prevotellaceae bacterium]
MKKLKSSLKNMLLVLTGVTAVSVALLAVVNELTKAPIAAANAKALNEALRVVLPEFDNTPAAESDTIRTADSQGKAHTFIVYPAKKGDTKVGAAVEATSLGFGGDMKVLVGFDAYGNIVDYSLLSHAETPGLGSKAADWFKQGKGDIKGLNPGNDPLAVTKDGGQIDAITASTITSRAFLRAVNDAYSAYSGQEIDGTSGATPQANSTTDTVSSATLQAIPADSTGVK